MEVSVILTRPGYGGHTGTGVHTVEPGPAAGKRPGGTEASFLELRDRTGGHFPGIPL